MSDPKRATLITVGAPKSAKNSVNKTVRLTINLVESNESKYPELNYKELVFAEERNKKVENGKTPGLNSFSDNDEDVVRVAKKFEQKYGGKSTYGRKGRSKHDDFADIGAGYDESDSFIDNTDGYDEMIPPECDTVHGGFYINCGSLEFKSVPDNQAASDGDRRNKRRISSSSSEEESSESSSESESQDEKDPKPVANGVVDSHKTDHRKKTTEKTPFCPHCWTGKKSKSQQKEDQKNKNIDKKKAKKVRRTDSSAATSGKQTSDDNAHGDADSADTTSQSNSLTSKPAPSSETAVTSDSSRDIDAKLEVKLPPQVEPVLGELEAAAGRALAESPDTKDLLARMDEHINRLQSALCACGANPRVTRSAWLRAAAALRTPRAPLLQRVRARGAPAAGAPASTPTTYSNPEQAGTALTVTSSGVTAVPVTSLPAAPVTSSAKRKFDDDLGDFDPTQLSDEEREAKIVETLKRLKALIDERKPAMIANYNAECERVQEERKKMQSAIGPVPEKRLPKRRFPWCGRARALLARLRRLAGGASGGAGGPGAGAAADLLARRALPLFPAGFVRMPTLLRQADLSKDIKVSDIKRQRLGSSSQPANLQSQMQFTEPIQFPSSLTVTASNVKPEKAEGTGTDEKPYKSNSGLGSIINSYTLSKDLVVEKPDKKESDKIKEDLYIPPNNIESITITPVPNIPLKSEKKINNNMPTEKPTGLIRVKSPAALNDMVKKDKTKNDVVIRDDHVKKDKPRNVTVNDRNRDEAKKDKARCINTNELINRNDSVKKDRLKNVTANDLVHHHRDKVKKLEEKVKNHEKRVPSPLHVDTSYQPSKKDPSPKQKDDPIPQKQIESMRVAENNIPRPALVPVHHSPTFAKPDKRPPEVKKKKEILIVSDVDPLSTDFSEPLAVDDSSSDVEVVEDNRTEASEVKRSDKSETVPSKDQVSVDSKKVNNVKCKSGKERENKKNEAEESTNEDINTLMRNLRDLQNRESHGEESTSVDIDTLLRNKREHSQEPTKFNSSSYGGVANAAAQGKWPRPALQRSASLGEARRADKLAERTSLNKTDGCSPVNGST